MRPEIYALDFAPGLVLQLSPIGVRAPRAPPVVGARVRVCRSPGLPSFHRPRAQLAPDAAREVDLIAMNDTRCKPVVNARCNRTD